MHWFGLPGAKNSMRITFYFENSVVVICEKRLAATLAELSTDVKRKASNVKSLAFGFPRRVGS